MLSSSCSRGYVYVDLAQFKLSHIGMKLSFHLCNPPSIANVCQLNLRLAEANVRTNNTGANTCTWRSSVEKPACVNEVISHKRECRYSAWSLVPSKLMIFSIAARDMLLCNSSTKFTQLSWWLVSLLTIFFLFAEVNSSRNDQTDCYLKTDLKILLKHSISHSLLRPSAV